jgi:hypothetical protein
MISSDQAGSLLRYAEVLSLARPGSRSWSRALAGKLFAASTLGARSAMMETIDAIHGVEPEPEAASAFASSLGFIACTLLLIGQFELSEVFVTRMDRFGGSLMASDAGLRGWFELVYASRAVAQGDMWAGLTLGRRAAASFAEAGYQAPRTVTLVNGSTCLLLLGAQAECQESLEALVAGGELPSLMATVAKYSLVQAKAERGALDEALADATAMVDAALTPHPGSLGDLRLRLARIKLARRDLEAAEREALLALDLLVPNVRDRALALATLADIQLAQHRPAEALASVEQAMATVQSIPPAYRTGAYLPLVHAEALEATGDHAGARETIARARTELLARADAIGDPAYRKTFLENVPENARLMARARRRAAAPAPPARKPVRAPAARRGG